jgi:hypothetical protein
MRQAARNIASPIRRAQQKAAGEGLSRLALRLSQKPL